MTNSERTLAYLENSLSEVERKNFEKDLNSNPELQQELNFQQEIISGIKNARKQELKQMLNNVPVSGSSLSNSFNSTIWKSLGITAVTVLTGFSIYYFWPESSEEEENLTEYTIPESEINDKISGDTQNEILSLGEEIVETEEINKQDLSPGRTQSSTVQPIEEEEPSINTPKGLEEENNDTSTEIDLPVEELFEPSQATDPIIVDVIDDGDYNFHYQFKNSELILYGNFTEPYELLDLLKNGKRALYLYYKDAYYVLDVNNSKVTELIEIQNSDLITKLHSIREN